jgi:hypothetical protein
MDVVYVQKELIPFRSFKWKFLSSEIKRILIQKLLGEAKMSSSEHRPA